MMDAEIAARVMCEPPPFVTYRDALERQLAGVPYTSPEGNWILLCRFDGGDEPCWQPIAFSSDTRAAWKLVELLDISIVRSEDGWYAIKPEDIEHGCVRGTSFPTLTLVGREHERWEACETAPLAICRAALLSLEPVEP